MTTFSNDQQVALASKLDSGTATGAQAAPAKDTETFIWQGDT